MPQASAMPGLPQMGSTQQPHQSGLQTQQSQTSQFPPNFQMSSHFAPGPQINNLPSGPQGLQHPPGPPMPQKSSSPQISQQLPGSPMSQEPNHQIPQPLDTPVSQQSSPQVPGQSAPQDISNPHVPQHPSISSLSKQPQVSDFPHQVGGSGPHIPQLSQGTRLPQSGPYSLQSGTQIQQPSAAMQPSQGHSSGAGRPMPPSLSGPVPPPSNAPAPPGGYLPPQLQSQLAGMTINGPRMPPPQQNVSFLG